MKARPTKTIRAQGFQDWSIKNLDGEVLLSATLSNGRTMHKVVSLGDALKLVRAKQARAEDMFNDKLKGAYASILQ